MDVKKLKDDLYSKVLVLRAIERLVTLPFFQQAWQLSNDVERIVALKCIEEYKKEELVIWAREIIEKNSKLDDMTMRQLRYEARRHGVKEYSTKTKSTLIFELTDLIRKRELYDNLDSLRTPSTKGS